MNLLYFSGYKVNGDRKKSIVTSALSETNYRVKSRIKKDKKLRKTADKIYMSTKI